MLAQGVEVQAVEAGEALAFEVLGQYAESAAGAAGVVEVDFHFRVLGVDPHAEALVLGHHRAVFLELVERVEDDVVAAADDFLDVLFAVGGAVGVDFLAEFLVTQPGFDDARGSRAPEVLADLGEGAPHGEALQGEQDPAAGALLDGIEDLEIALQEGLVDNVDGGLYLIEIVPAVVHCSISSGLL